MFRVTAKPSTMQMSRLGSIFGQIWLHFDTVRFPNAGYSDMVVVLLGHWSQELIKLKNGRIRVSLYFMDDPYHMNVSWYGADWRIRCMRHAYRPAKCVAETVQHPSCVLHAIKVAARKIVNECNRRAWNNSDVQCLQSALRSLS